MSSSLDAFFNYGAFISQVAERPLGSPAFAIGAAFLPSNEANFGHQPCAVTLRLAVEYALYVSRCFLDASLIDCFMRYSVPR